VSVNKILATEIKAVVSNADQAKLRIQLIIQWWEEFHNNYDDVTSWLDETETGLSQLLARYQSTQPPRVSPVDLHQEIKVASPEHVSKQPLATLQQVI
jgi:hypothetical protein